MKALTGTDLESWGIKEIMSVIMERHAYTWDVWAQEQLGVLNYADQDMLKALNETYDDLKIGSYIEP